MNEKNEVLRLGREVPPLSILFEDEYFMILNKPPEILCVPDRWDKDRVNLMGALHAGILNGTSWATQRDLDFLSNVHRLDFGTSGVWMLAKTRDAKNRLCNMFLSRTMHKEYHALVFGSPAWEEHTVDLALVPDRAKPGLMKPSRGGKASVTEFHVLERFRKYTLVRALPHTGRQHQVRVHLSTAGFPIVGDIRYGGPKEILLSHIKKKYTPGKRKERPLIAHTALHSTSLSFVHPWTEEPFMVEAPYSKDFAVALKYLRRYSSIGGRPAGGNDL